MATNKSKSDEKSTPTGRPVLVTTQHKGVFFGYALDTSGAVIELKKARLCIYWSTAMQGFMGLAAIGPDRECKIGPEVDTIELRDITSVVAVTPAAADKWASATFGGR